MSPETVYRSEQRCRSLIKSASNMAMIAMHSRLSREFGEAFATSIPPYAIASMVALNEHHPMSMRHSINLARRASALERVVGLDAGSELARDFKLAALIHDIGKSSIAVETLNGKVLKGSEREVLVPHPTIMFRLLGAIVPRAAQIAVCHHEEGLDRAHYPRASEVSVTDSGTVCLRQETSFVVRQLSKVLAVLDTIDALSDLERSYREPMEKEELITYVSTSFGEDMIRIARVAVEVQV